MQSGAEASAVSTDGVAFNARPSLDAPEKGTSPREERRGKLSPKPLEKLDLDQSKSASNLTDG